MLQRYKKDHLLAVDGQIVAQHAEAEAEGHHI